MRSFAAGILCALVLAGGSYFAMQAGTVTMVERSSDVSVVVGAGLWDEQRAVAEADQ